MLSKKKIMALHRWIFMFFVCHLLSFYLLRISEAWNSISVLVLLTGLRRGEVRQGEVRLSEEHSGAGPSWPKRRT